MSTTRRQAREQAIRDRDSFSRLRIDALPSELISLILLLYLQAIEPLVVGRYQPGITRSHIMTEIRLVCSRWNSVAITTPSLWTKVCVDSLGCLIPARILSLWLDRSGRLPLDVQIKFDHPFGDTFIGPIPETLHVLGNSISRWQSLNLKVDQHVAHLFYHLPLADALLLKSLGIHARVHLPEAFFAHIRALPNLRIIRLPPLGKVPPRIITHSMQQILGNLTYLCLREYGLKWKRVSQICQQCRLSISVLDLDLDWGSQNDRSYNKPHSSSPITFPNLTILKARITNMPNIPTLRPLFSFHASQLQVLDICLDRGLPDHYTDFRFAEELSTYLSEVRCTLQILSVRYILRASAIGDVLRIPAIASIPLVEIGWACKFRYPVTAFLDDQSRELGRDVTILYAWNVETVCPIFFIGWNETSRSIPEYHDDRILSKNIGLIEYMH